MKNVITVDSNSKSEDTSLDDYLIDLVDEHFPKGKSKERGQANVMLAYFVMWHKAEVAKLLQVIEDEVIGEDEEPDRLMGPGMPSFHRDRLRRQQREAINKVKERL